MLTNIMHIFFNMTKTVEMQKTGEHQRKKEIGRKLGGKNCGCTHRLI